MNESGTLKIKHPSEKSRFLAVAVPLAMLTAITFLAFANALPDRFVYDDILFSELARGGDADSLYNIFTQDVWAAAGYRTGLYRPLLMLDLSLESRVLGDWLVGYHLSNLFLHLLVTFLVYGFFRHLLCTNGNQSSSSDLYALLAALVFAVHPVHTEVVNSIFNRSGMMVALFGIAGLWWLLHYLDAHRARAWFGLGITYFLAMLCKESAAAIPGLAVVLILLMTPGNLISRVRKCLPVFWLILPLALYLVMRAHALAPPGLEGVGQAVEGAEVAAMIERASLPDSDKFLKVAGMLGGSLKVIAWPYPLKLFYPNPSTPILVMYLTLNLVLVIAALIQLSRKRYSLAAGLAFFYISMLPASRIIDMGESPPHLAERYLYFPSVGLAIILAFAFRAFAQRFGRKILVGFGMPVLLVLTALTWDRNSNWVSVFSLFETEYQQGYRGGRTLYLLSLGHLSKQNTGRVVDICDENPGEQEIQGQFSHNCALAYESQRRYEEAERAYLLATQKHWARVSASASLAHFYVRQRRWQDAEDSFTAAIDWTLDPAVKALYQGDMIASLNPGDREQLAIARDHVMEALRLDPGWPKAQFMLRQMDAKLNSSPNQEIDGKE